MFTLDCDRAYLNAHPERELTPRRNAALRRRSRAPRYRRSRAVHHRASGILGPGSDRVASGADSSSGDGARGGGGAGTLAKAQLATGEGARPPRAKSNRPHRRCGHRLGSDCDWRWRKSCRRRRSTQPIFLAEALEVARANAAAAPTHFANRVSPCGFARWNFSASFVRHSWFQILPTSASRRRFSAARSPQVRAAPCGLRRSNRAGGNRAAYSPGADRTTTRRLAGIRDQRDDCRSRAEIAIGLGGGRNQERLAGDRAGGRGEKKSIRRKLLVESRASPPGGQERRPVPPSTES
jgi:hypothetical protein